MIIFTFFNVMLFFIYGAISKDWLGWTIASPEFWAILAIILFIALFSFLEGKYDR